MRGVLARTSILSVVAGVACLVSFSMTRALDGGSDVPPVATGGGAILDILIDGPDLFLDLDVPATSLLGFGHAPTNRVEHEALLRAHRLLDSDALFAPTAEAGCTLTEAFATVGHGYDDLCSIAPDMLGGPAFTVPSPGSGRASASSIGGEVSARLTWLCTAPERLERLDVSLHERFAALGAVEVRIEGPAGERTGVLLARRPRLELGDSVRRGFRVSRDDPGP